MKKIITIKRSTLGTNIVFRSLFSRKWLFNLTIAPKDTLEIKTTAVNVVAKIGIGYALVATALLILGACTNSVNGPTPTPNKGDMVSTRYIDADSISVSCFWSYGPDNQRDSLKVGKTKYTISERSRYRTDWVSSEFDDVLFEGDYNSGDWAYYRDTMNDSIYVFLSCDSRDALKAERGE